MSVTDEQSNTDCKNLDCKDFMVGVSLENAGTRVEDAAHSTGMRHRLKAVFGCIEWTGWNV